MLLSDFEAIFLQKITLFGLLNMTIYYFMKIVKCINEQIGKAVDSVLLRYHASVRYKLFEIMQYSYDINDIVSFLGHPRLIIKNLGG